MDLVKERKINETLKSKIDVYFNIIIFLKIEWNEGNFYNLNDAYNNSFLTKKIY